MMEFHVYPLPAVQPLANTRFPHLLMEKPAPAHQTIAGSNEIIYVFPKDMYIT